MQLLTQAEFVRKCMDKYFFTDIPPDQKWETAHFPLPKCSGEDSTVLLWSADHTVQGLLQSVEFDYQCFHGKANKKDLYNLETYYPEYLELFKQLKSQFSSRQGKKTAELKLGIHAPGMQSAGGKIGGKKGGKIGGKKTAELKVGVHGRSAEQMSASGKKGGKKGGKISSKITNAQQWQCLITGHISNPGGLSTYQKKRGIDTSLRIQL